MICFSSEGISVSHNGEIKESHGPYGYLCLGLVYLWNNENKCLNIDKIILVKMDLKLRCPITAGLYYDMFQKPFSDVYEKNGIFFYRGLPIINYKQLNIPKKMVGIKEIQKDSTTLAIRFFYNNEGPLKYSINPISGNACGDFFEKKYYELYSCILDFDENTLQGSAVGFEILGKITPITNKVSVDILYKNLVYDSEHRLSWEEYYEESCKRSKEFGFLNLSVETDAEGNKKYKYTSIWDNIDMLIALNAQELEDETMGNDGCEAEITVSKETDEKLAERGLDNMTYDEAIESLIESCQNLKDGIEFYEKKS